MTTFKPPAKYYPEVDGVRGLAALFVVLHHAYLQVAPDVEARPPGALAGIGSVLLHGRFAVDAFIVVSGFCLMMPVIRSGGLRGGVLDFYERRFRRIVVPYWAAIGVSLILTFALIGRPTGTHWDVSLPATWRAVAVNLVGWSDQFYRGSVNHVFWSICIELKIYATFPLMVAAWRRFGLPMTAVGVWGASAAAQKLVGRLGAYGFALPFFPLFMIGTVAAAVVSSADARWDAARRRVPWRVVWLSAAATLAVRCIRHGYGLVIGPEVSALAATAAAALIVDVCTRDSWYARALAAPRLVNLGTYSFSLYLLHAPALQVVHQYLLMPMGLSKLGQFAGLCLAGVPASLVAARLFASVFEAGWFINRRSEVARAREVIPAHLPA